MNIEEWNETWQRIKDRFSNWEPTKTESYDWCLGLKIYKKEMVESVGHWVASTYSAKEPKLAWYLRECEKRKKKRRVLNVPSFKDDMETQYKEHEERVEFIISELEKTSLDDLRVATVAVLREFGHLISKPPSGNPREWKQTLRAMVYLKLYGGK
jgi:hypothetical protein